MRISSSPGFEVFRGLVLARRECVRGTVRITTHGAPFSTAVLHARRPAAP
jgi:hypothetical protein